jgi:hypothetical protein
VAEFLDIPPTKPDGIADWNRIGDNLRPSLADEALNTVVERDGVPVRYARIEPGGVARLQAPDRGCASSGLSPNYQVILNAIVRDDSICPRKLRDDRKQHAHQAGYAVHVSPLSDATRG